MKKRLLFLLLTVITLIFASCSQGAGSRNIPKTKTVKDVLNQETAAAAKKDSKTTASGGKNSNKTKADIDLTELNSTMVYSEVYNMMSTPEKYIGKTVRMNGAAAINKIKNQTYYACIIKDAAACCSQGIEFVLKNGNYPEDGTDITVLGTFTTYKEENKVYCQLKDSVLE